MNYSQIMSPRPPLPRKVGVMTPSSYGSAAPGNKSSLVVLSNAYVAKMLAGNRGMRRAYENFPDI